MLYEKAQQLPFDEESHSFEWYQSINLFELHSLHDGESHDCHFPSEPASSHLVLHRGPHANVDPERLIGLPNFHLEHFKLF